MQPFLTKQKYTFPIWLVQPLFDELKPMGGVPANWIVGRNGVIRWEHIGFDGSNEEQWADSALAKMREEAQPR